ncbi:sensor histidine kinase KdpD [Bradyrhizobium liaoningense]|uniref:sensor histidine kinase n=1 Tax=Bradyrhizobium liaoningense TaxID=43992 RepID=UPI001BA9D157|nr:HAMP domain-containing sensor histidine kinase [Bradyrhizobium liaoningense]MBR0816628.1 HAMP domain-containing histidine kinase [Bradyrhizobium liaoningense]
MCDVNNRVEAETFASPCSERRKNPVSSEAPSDFEVVLLAIAGHDLRQPLQILQSAQERLGNGSRTKSELRLLEIGQNAIDQLKRQLDQLIGAVRLHQRADHMQLAPVSLEPLLQQVSRDNESFATEKGIQIRVVPSRSLVMSDAFLLGAILGNLVGNAVKYTRPGGRILMGCRRFGSRIRIDVIDTGIGMTSHEMARIFDAFTRIDSTESDGLGIGLFIVRRATAIIGHRIDVNSAPSHGTRFSILAEMA